MFPFLPRGSISPYPKTIPTVLYLSRQASARKFGIIGISAPDISSRIPGSLPSRPIHTTPWINSGSKGSSFSFFCADNPHLLEEQRKTALAIIHCKSKACGCNVYGCTECGHTETHYNFCRSRHCPNCQAVKTELWVDKRRSEVIDSPYFHVIFTLPHELNPLIYCNQKLLYGLLHQCCAEPLLQLASDRKYLGAQPGIFQVLHTWNQQLDYHVHMHCILFGGGLTPDRKFRTSVKNFFLPVSVLRDKFKGKYLALLDSLYLQNRLVFSSSCQTLRNSYEWQESKNLLYSKDWCPYIKETFRGFGNAIEYLGRYTHKIAISNSRIRSVTDTQVSFSARGKQPGGPKRTFSLSHMEFIRRFLLHVLPRGFQKIRYYGFLNNRMKSENLKLLFKLQGHQRFRRRYTGMSMAELLKTIWKFDCSICPACGRAALKPAGRTYALLL